MEEGRKVGTHRSCLGPCTFLLPQGAPEYFSSPLRQEKIPPGPPTPAFSGLRWLGLVADPGEHVGTLGVRLGGSNHPEILGGSPGHGRREGEAEGTRSVKCLSGG